MGCLPLSEKPYEDSASRERHHADHMFYMTSTNYPRNETVRSIIHRFRLPPLPPLRPLRFIGFGAA
jgi:hypothetical protein